MKTKFKQIQTKLNSDLHLKEILTGSAITFVLKMSGMLLGYLIVLIISRQYGAEGIGVYNLTLSIMMFIAMIGSMGMNVSILRYVGQFNKSDEEYNLKLLYRYAVELVVPFSILLGVLLYFFAGAIAENFFHNPIYKPALEFAAFIVPFLALHNISVEFIRGLKELKVSEFLRSVNAPVINIFLLIFLGMFLVNELLPIYTLSVGIVLSSTFAFLFIIKKIQIVKSKKVNEFSKNEFIITSAPMMITVIASYLIGNVPLFMLETYSTTYEVGVFSVVIKVATLISVILVVVNTISAPKISELYWSKKYDELQIVVNHTSKLILISSLILAAIIIPYANHILLIFGEGFIVGGFALILLVFGQIINAATGPVSIFLNMTGKQHILKNIIILVTIFTVISSYYFIPIYGINGAALSFMLGQALLNITAMIYVKFKLNYTTYYNPFFKVIKNG